MQSILLVDDELDAEDLFKQKFRREIRNNQYEILYAESGHRALEMLKMSGAPDVKLVLSDINMPEMSGLDLLCEVKSHRSSLPVIMVSAYGDEGTETESVKRGALGIVQKPVNFTDLKGLLAEILEDDKDCTHSRC